MKKSFLILFLFLGCDGAGEVPTNVSGIDAEKSGGEVPAVVSGVDAGKSSSDAGMTVVPEGKAGCPVPYPTGEGQEKPYRYIFSSTDVVAVCNTLKNTPNLPYLTDKQTGTLSTKTFADTDCRDPSHDFQGTTGWSWCLVNNGCAIDNPTKDCPIVSFREIEAVEINTWKPFAVCSPKGVFMGWGCTNTLN